jgi:Ca2+-binding RTX toxin-like protein
VTARTRALLCALITLTTTATAEAAITPTRDAGRVAQVIVAEPSPTPSATFPLIPPAPGNQAECNDGIDNDEDGLIDFAGNDPDCPNAQDNRESPDAVAQCANGFDDDGDDKIDFAAPNGQTADPGCSSASDDNEEDGAANPTPQCSNGVDDDGDDKIDFAPATGQTADPGCSSAGDLDEGSEGLPLGEDADAAATADAPLAGFPTAGGSFAILSSGDTEFADDPNDSGATSQASGTAPGTEVHGERVLDLVKLRVDVVVPVGANCAQIDFKFLSEEFPEFVGSSFNDGFVAELDTSNFTATPDATNAPNNFAFDAQSRVVSVNTTGFSEAQAAGTTYDGATPLLRASTPITPGSHSFFFSVYDVSDQILDSAVFIDNLRFSTAAIGQCERGASDPAAPLNPNPTPTPSATATATASAVPTATATATATATPAPETTCDGLTPTRIGTAKNNVIRGTKKRDVIASLGGNDRIIGRGGDDVLCGGDGRDRLIGSSGDDDLFGGGGNDLLVGNGGDDELDGEAGKDRCRGGGGKDKLRSCEK